MAHAQPPAAPATPSASANPADARDAPDLSALVALLRTFWRYRGTFAGVTVLVLAVAALAASRLSPTYRATAEILLTQREPSASAETDAPVQPDRDRADIASEIEVITSRGLLAEVVRRLDLQQMPAFNPALGNEPGPLQALGLAPATEPIPESRQTGRTIAALRQRLTVRPLGQSRVIAVTVADGRPERAARLANAVAERYLAARAESDARAAQSVTRDLREQVAALRDSLETAERKAARYRREAGLIADDGTPAAAERVTALTEQLAAARSSLDTARAKLDAAETARERAPRESTPLRSDALADLRAQAATLRRKRAELAATYGRKHPEMQAVRTELRKQRRAIERAERAIVDDLRADVAVAERRVRRLHDRLAAARQRAADRQARAVRLKELDRRVAAQREVYETMLAQLKQRTLGPIDDRPKARVISRADVPGAPSSPDVPLIMALAAVVAVSAGGVASVLRAQLDSGIADRGEAETATGLPVLATIPEARPGGRGHPADRAGDASPGMFPEALQRLASGLQSVRAATSVVVTAADTREGKSTLALALARTHAARGERVLLIEADLRKPGLRRTLGLADGPGLAQVLQGRAGADAAVRLDPQSPLHVLPAGRTDGARGAGPSEPDLTALLRAAGRHYDRIVLDAPPVLFVHEAVRIAAAADTCVLAVRWRRTRPASVQRAVTELQRAGADPAGVALTRVHPRGYAETGAGDDVAYGRRARAYYGA